MKKALLLALLLLSLNTLFGAEIFLRLDYVNDQVFRHDYYDRIALEIELPFSQNMGYVFDCSLAHDGLKKSGWEDAMLDQYWDSGKGYIEWKDEKLDLKLGLQHFSAGRGDEYKLFLREEVGSFNGLSISWNPVPWFSFNNQLVMLRFAPAGVSSLDGDENFAKGVYYRSYSLSPLDVLTVGFQEAILFIDRNFDPWYAFSIFPYTAVQEMRHMIGASRESINDNAMVGAYLDYDDGNLNAYVDFLLDDLNGNAFLRPDASPTVNKLAFDAGIEFGIGSMRLSVEGALASAYVFERTSASRPYEYSRGEGDVMAHYTVEDNMLGYKYGENSGSVCLKVEHSSGVYLKYEKVLLGERTPWLPWHGEPTYQPGTSFFLDGIIERRSLIESGYGDSFELAWFDLDYNIYGGLLTIQKDGSETERLPIIGLNFELHKSIH